MKNKVTKKKPVKKVKTIPVAKEIKELVPEIFKKLPADNTYKLTKIGIKTYKTMVFPGNAIIGKLSIVAVATGYEKSAPKLPGVRVEHMGGPDYIRTSPIINVLDTIEDTILFETMGGFYKLEKL